MPHLPKEKDFSRSRARVGGGSNPVGGSGGMLASGPLSAAVTSPAGAERRLSQCNVQRLKGQRLKGQRLKGQTGAAVRAHAGAEQQLRHTMHPATSAGMQLVKASDAAC